MTDETQEPGTVSPAIGSVMVIRFPRDTVPVPAVAIVRAVRRGKALVSKSAGRDGRHWARPRWVPVDDISRPATERERILGMPIDPIPPRRAT